jgi:hypothetical protein
MASTAHDGGAHCAWNGTLIINFSIKKFCNGGCRAIYDEVKVRVYYKGKMVLSGGRDKSIGLWLLPIAEESSTPRQENTAFAALNLQLPREKTDRAAPTGRQRRCTH